MRLLNRLAVVLGWTVFVSAAVQSQTAPTRVTPEAVERVAPLVDALQLPEVLALIREEGIGEAAEIESHLFAGKGGADWGERVGDIYDTARMQAVVTEGLAETLPAWHLEPLLDFFNSEAGRRIVSLEIAARRAMLDPQVEAASEDAFSDMRARGSARLDALETFVRGNDLVERNVVTTLNAHYSFYAGLNSHGAFSQYQGEEDILRDVWAREGEVREQIETWLFSYLALAYQPLTERDLQAYIALSETDAGRTLNTVLFDVFDDLARTTSYEIGSAAARFMAGEDI